MSWSQIGRILAFAAVFAAAPAIAANQSYSPGRYYGSAQMPYLGDPFTECRGRPSELEVRACLARLLDEAEDDLEWVNARLDRLASSFEDERVRTYHQEKLRGARTTWAAYLDYHCDFEGAMLGDDNTEVGLQSIACQIMLMRVQAYRLDVLADNISVDIDLAVTPGTRPERPRCNETSFREWQVNCDEGGRYRAQTTAGSSTLSLVSNPAGGQDLVFSTSAHALDTARSIDIRVDSNRTRTFRHAGGYAGPTAPGGIVVQNTAETAALISEMRRGGRLAVIFYDTAGRAQVANFSLIGVSDSLDSIGDQSRIYQPSFGR